MMKRTAYPAGVSRPSALWGRAIVLSAPAVDVDASIGEIQLTMGAIDLAKRVLANYTPADSWIRVVILLRLAQLGVMV